MLGSELQRTPPYYLPVYRQSITYMTNSWLLKLINFNVNPFCYYLSNPVHKEHPLQSSTKCECQLSATNWLRKYTTYYLTAKNVGRYIAKLNSWESFLSHMTTSFADRIIWQIWPLPNFPLMWHVSSIPDSDSFSTKEKPPVRLPQGYLYHKTHRSSYDQVLTLCIVSCHSTWTLSPRALNKCASTVLCTFISYSNPATAPVLLDNPLTKSLDQHRQNCLHTC